MGIIAEGSTRGCQLNPPPQFWDTHNQFSIKTLLSKKEKKEVRSRLQRNPLACGNVAELWYPRTEGVLIPMSLQKSFTGFQADFFF